MWEWFSRWKFHCRSGCSFHDCGARSSHLSHFTCFEYNISRNKLVSCFSWVNSEKFSWSAFPSWGYCLPVHQYDLRTPPDGTRGLDAPLVLHPVCSFFQIICWLLYQGFLLRTWNLQFFLLSPIKLEMPQCHPYSLPQDALAVSVQFSILANILSPKSRIF